MLSLLASRYIAPAARVSMSISSLQMQPHAHISHRDQAGIIKIHHEPCLMIKESSAIYSSTIKEQVLGIVKVAVADQERTEMLLKGVLLASYAAPLLMSENVSILPSMVCQPRKVRVKLLEHCRQTAKLALNI